MTKTILFAAAFALFSFAGLNATPAQACDCGCVEAHGHDHGEAKKPCEKTLGEKEPCEKTLGKKEPCEKTLGKKEPCEKTLGKKEPCEKTPGKSTTGTTAVERGYNQKGSFTFHSKKKFQSRDALYN